MSEQTANCPQCDGPFSFDPKMELVDCPHCGVQISLEEAVKSEQVFWNAAPPEDPLAPITPTAPDLNPVSPESPPQPPALPKSPPALPKPSPQSTQVDEAPDPQMQILPGWLKHLQKDKRQLFAFVGFASGMAGSLFSEFNPLSSQAEDGFLLIVHTAVWTAMFAGPIAYGLFWANSVYFRRRFAMKAQVRAIVCGIFSGMISGGIAQAVFNLEIESGFLKGVVLRTFCWGLMGMLLALGLTRAIPNLKTRHGALGGFAGGVVGGIAFLAVAIAATLLIAGVGDPMAEEPPPMIWLVDTIGRLLGIGLLGAALGLSIVIVESIFREASVEVQWGPHENTFLNLGAQPVTIGGGPEDNIYVRGLGAAHARIEFTEGQVMYVESATATATPLKEGSRLEIGVLTLVIHAKG